MHLFFPSIANARSSTYRKENSVIITKSESIFNSDLHDVQTSRWPRLHHSKVHMLQARRLQPSLLPHTWHCCAISKLRFDKSTVIPSIGDPALSTVINRTPATYLSTQKPNKNHLPHISPQLAAQCESNQQPTKQFQTHCDLTRVIHSPCWNPAYKQSWQEMFSIGNCASVKACKSNEIHVPTQWTSHPVIWSLEPSHEVKPSCNLKLRAQPRSDCRIQKTLTGRERNPPRHTQKHTDLRA